MSLSFDRRLGFFAFCNLQEMPVDVPSLQAELSAKAEEAGTALGCEGFWSPLPQPLRNQICLAILA